MVMQNEQGANIINKWKNPVKQNDLKVTAGLKYKQVRDLFQMTIQYLFAAFTIR